MGFSLKSMFSKRGLRGGLLALMGTPLAGAGTTFSDQANDAYESVHKGLGNLLTGGYIAQKEATEETKKARDQAAVQYQAEIDAAAETARKIAETEEERKRRLAALGTQTPSTLTGSYLGIPGRVNQSRSLLG
jgi:hypothetical protein